jgi:hypothetical protein
VVTSEEMERALRWLSYTDTELADWRVAVLRTEYLADVAESMAFKLLEGGVEERKREAKTVSDVRTAKENYFAAVRGFEKLRAQRKSAELLIETWRSENANRRVGNP